MYYKITAEDGSACYGGSGRWPLPDGDTPGAWWDLDEGQTPQPLVACKYGLHLFEARNIVAWIGPALWEAEYEGEILHHTDKVVVRKARLLRRVEAWNAKMLYLWAADCAERQLANFETLYPDDKRPRQALDAVRGYAAGTVTLHDLNAAWSEAWAAAVESAGLAARSAAERLAMSAERAAWSASESARSAAWSARSAASAASEAAWSAARSAASAARSAEGDWQTAHLLGLLGIAQERQGDEA